MSRRDPFWWDRWFERSALFVGLVSRCIAAMLALALMFVYGAYSMAGAIGMRRVMSVTPEQVNGWTTKDVRPPKNGRMPDYEVNAAGGVPVIRPASIREAYGLDVYGEPGSDMLLVNVTTGFVPRLAWVEAEESGDDVRLRAFSADYTGGPAGLYNVLQFHAIRVIGNVFGAGGYRPVALQSLQAAQELPDGTCRETSAYLSVRLERPLGNRHVRVANPPDEEPAGPVVYKTTECGDTILRILHEGDTTTYYSVASQPSWWSRWL